MKTIPNFKIRASASGSLMTNARSKTELLSETTKTYVQEWLKEHIYGVRKQINNKYLNKGIVLEDTAIDKAIEWLDLPMTLKNETYYENDYFCGTPDLIVNDTVLDIKCSWDCFTFPLFENEIPTKNYYYQLQVYMELLGLKKAKLVYVLLNTPEDLPSWEEKHNYDNLEKQYRIKTFDIEYDSEVIEELKNRVLNVREYINQLSNE
jgi:hypothetical protein